MKLARNIERWRLCDPKAIAAGSEAQCMFCIEDARHDILALTEALDTQRESAIDWIRNNYQDHNIASLCDALRAHLIEATGTPS